MWYPISEHDLTCHVRIDGFQLECFLHHLLTQ